MDATRRESIRELRPVLTLAALDFCELGDHAPVATVEIVADRLLLGFQAKTRAALTLCRDAVVGDELSGVLGSHAFRSQLYAKIHGRCLCCKGAPNGRQAGFRTFPCPLAPAKRGIA